MGREPGSTWQDSHAEATSSVVGQGLAHVLEAQQSMLQGCMIRTTK